jgi:acyl-CoA thioester hydrolase
VPQPGISGILTALIRPPDPFTGPQLQTLKDTGSFSWRVRVYYEDTDAGGLVFYANYLKFMERARTEWLRSLGFEQDALRERQGVLFAVRRAALDYLQPARFNDLLRITTAVVRCGGASLDFRQEVLREADAILCCRGEVRIACVHAVTLRPHRIPDNLLAEIANVL